MRNVIFKLHLYAALSFGVFIFILGVTGSAMVFTEELDHSSNPDFFTVPAAGSPLPVSEVRTIAASQVPATKAAQLFLPQRAGGTYFVAAQGKHYFFNPYTGQLAGSREAKTWISTLSKLHTSLLLDETGAAVVHISSIVLLFLAISGVYLWLPYKRWRIALSATLRRTAFDAHLSMGIFAVALIALFALTGIVLSFEHTVRTVLASFEAKPGPNRNVPSQFVPGVRPLSPDEAIVAAAKVFPQAKPLFVQSPAKPTASYIIGMRFPEDRTPIGRSWVTIEQYTGRPLASVSSRTAPRPVRTLILARALHTGDILGMPSRVVMFLASLVVALQAVTGCYLWWKKFRGVARGSSASTVAAAKP